MEFLTRTPYSSQDSELLVSILNEAFGRDIAEMRKHAAALLTYAETADYKIFKPDYIYELSYAVSNRNFILSKRKKAPSATNTEVYYIPVDFMIHYCMVKGFSIDANSIEIWQNGCKGSFLAILKDFLDKVIHWHISIEKTITAAQIKALEQGEYKLSNKLVLDDNMFVNYSHSNRGVLVTCRMKQSTYNKKAGGYEDSLYFVNNFYPDCIINQITA